MDSILDLLWLRCPRINYVSPPACDNISSGSGSSGPIVVIEHPPRFKVTGLRVVNCTLLWDPLPGACEGACSVAICYNIYRQDTEAGYEVVAECVQGTEFSVAGQTACFRVSAITTQGESDLSDAVCVECGPLTPEPPIPPDPPVDPTSEVSRSIDGAAFTVVEVPGESSLNPTLLLGVDSTIGSIKLNWDLSYIDTSGGMGIGAEWCYKVQGTEPAGNFSNVACAVNAMTFLGVGAVSYPEWQIAFGDLVSDDGTLVTSLDFSGLRAVIGGTLALDATFTLTSIDLSSLISVSGNFQLSATTLTTLSLPAFTTLGGDLFCDNTTLVSVSIPVLVLLNGNTYAFDSSALDAASVEGILARGVASAVTSATIRLDGGTNAGLASLSAQGQADYAALVTAGNTMTSNP